MSVADDLADCERILPLLRGRIIPLNDYSTLRTRQFAMWLEQYKRGTWTGWQREVADSMLHERAEALRRWERERP